MTPETACTARGPDGLCQDGCYEVRFGALPPLPDGYSVWWHSEHEHYQWHGPGDVESCIDCDRFACYRGAREHAKRGCDA